MNPPMAAILIAAHWGRRGERGRRDRVRRRRTLRRRDQSTPGQETDTTRADEGSLELARVSWGFAVIWNK